MHTLAKNFWLRERATAKISDNSEKIEKLQKINKALSKRWVYHHRNFMRSEK